MAPKRKRNERAYSTDASETSSRPSPHRPQNLNLAQQQGQSTAGGRGGRRVSNRNPSRSGNVPAAQNSPATAIASTGRDSGTMPPPSTVHAKENTAAHSPAKLAPPVSQVMNVEPPKRAFIGALPFFYSFVTDARISQWQESGRESVRLQAAQELQKENITGLSAIMLEIIRSAMTSRLKPEAAGSLVKAILRDDKDPNHDLSPSRHFVDLFATLAEPGLPSPFDMRHFLDATGLPSSFMREQFETSLLEQLHMVRNTFTKYGTRFATNVLYKQTTYNLLREDTEGYAKLIAEYYHAAESGPATAELVSEAFQKVKSLVGAFNLDSGRALDVTLDVFGDLLIKRHRFFVRFLRASSFWPHPQTLEGVKRDEPGFSFLPWWTALDYPGGYVLTDEDKLRLDGLKEQRDHGFWDRVRKVGMRAFFELGGRQIITDAGHADEGTIIPPEQRTDDQEWIAITKTYPPQGNKIASQLLGFKLRYYSSAIREDVQVPENLIWLAALLIHIGFISLKDLYPHLYPADESMPDVEAKLRKEKEERDMKKRPGGGANALMMAAALVDDTLPAPARLREPENKASPQPDASGETSIPEEKPMDEPRNQKIMLLESLLLIGAIPDALFILGSFPWILELSPTIMEYIHRILHHSVSEVYQQTQPLADRDSLRTQKSFVYEQSGLPRGDLQSKQGEIRRIKKWGRLDKQDATLDSDFKFYWDDWSDNVPICRSVDDLFTLCNSFLNLCGVRVGEDAELLVKLSRIGIHSTKEDKSDANINRWIDLCKRLIVPALSFTRSNPGAVNQVWDLIRTFSLSTRYSIYAEWFLGTTSRQSAMKDAFALSRAETKDIMKRISTQNTKEMARALAKAATSSPGVVFSVALNQIESYDNLIAVVIECARYFTTMGYDILTWSVLSSLGGGGRERVQLDGTFTNKWLERLSKFAGDVCKRYSVMNPSPILRYFASQLRNGRCEDMEILQQLIESMAGIKSEQSCNPTQLQSLMGGPLVREILLVALNDKRFELKTSSKRLIRSLQESDLVLPLLVLLAQERQLYAYRESSEEIPLKVLASNMDTIHTAFIQYLETIRYNLPDKEFTAQVPDVVSLINDYGLETPIAFLISRDSLRQRLIEHKKAKSEQKHGKVNGEELEAASADKPSETLSTDSAQLASHEADAESKTMADVEMNNIARGDATDEIAKNPTASHCHPVVESLVDRLRNTLRTNFEQSMSIPFFVWFWQLGNYDIYSPKKTYNNEGQNLKDRQDKIVADRKDVSVEATHRKKMELNRLEELRSSIKDERAAQLNHIQTCKNDMRKESAHWFAHLPMSRIPELSTNIIQDCVLPRVVLSPLDAYYTCKFVFLVHSFGEEHFQTIRILDNIFNDVFLQHVLFHCTTREAVNFGSFINEVLMQLSRWHTKSKGAEKDLRGGKLKDRGAKDPTADMEPKDIYEQEAWGAKKNLPGFCTKFNPDGTPKELLDWEDFRRLLFKWHGRLHQALKSLLTDGEYMHVRNAITLLQAIHTEYPRINYQGNQLMECIINLGKDERRDLAVSASSFLPNLRNRQKDWLIPQQFRIPLVTPGTAPINAPPNESKEGAGESTTETAEANKALNPAVPEFTPSPIPVTAKASSAGEVEDGEINDSKKEINATVNKGKTDAAQPSQAGDREDATLELRDSEPSRSTEKSSEPFRGPTKVSEDNLRSEHLQMQTANGQRSPIHKSDTRRPGSQLAQPPIQHALPNRPEGELPKDRITHPHLASDRTKDRPESRSGGEILRDGRGRLADAPGNRSRNRTPESQPGIGRGGREMRESRQTREPARDGRELFDRTRGAPSRDTRTTERMAPRSEAPKDRAYDLTHGPERPDGRDRQPMPANAEAEPRDPLINPERAALIGQGPQKSTPERRSDRVRDPESTRRHEGERSDRDVRNLRPSRNRSPRRAEEGTEVTGSHPNSRSAHELAPERHSAYDRLPPSDFGSHGRDYPQDMDRPPSGPRSDRHARNDMPDTSGRSRELFQHPSGSRGPDPVQGRLFSQEHSMPRPPSQDPNYGRLNPVAEGPPSGPRVHKAARPARTIAGPSPLGPNNNQNYPMPDRPGAGASAEPPRQQRSQSNEGAHPRALTEPTVAVTGPGNVPANNVSGMHPDRQRQIQAPVNVEVPNRQRQIQAPLNVDVPTGPASHSSQPSPSMPPIGPRNRQPGSNFAQAPSPTARNPPAGPAGPDRRDTRLLINSHLQQAGDNRGPGARGGRGRNHQSHGPENGAVSPATSQVASVPGVRDIQLLAPPPPQSTSRPDVPRNTHASVERSSRAFNHPDTQPSDDRSDNRRSNRRETGDRSQHRHRSRSRSPLRHSRHGQDDYREREPRKAADNGPLGEREPSRRSTRGPGRDDRDREHDGHARSSDTRIRGTANLGNMPPRDEGAALRAGGRRGPPDDLFDSRSVASQGARGPPTLMRNGEIDGRPSRVGERRDDRRDGRGDGRKRGRQGQGDEAMGQGGEPKRRRGE